MSTMSTRKMMKDVRPNSAQGNLFWSIPNMSNHVPKTKKNRLTDQDLLSRRGQDLELESLDEFLDGIIADIEAEEMLRRGGQG